MGRATRTELLWAYAITCEEFLKHVNDKIELHPEEWKNIRETLFDALSKGELPIYEPKMNAVLEQTVYKYLRPTDEPISLTDTARRFDSENPSYLIQSWLRSRNTIELKWMRILRFFAITFFAFPQLMTFLTIFTIGIVSYEELVRDLNTEQKNRIIATI